MTATGHETIPTGEHGTDALPHYLIARRGAVPTQVPCAAAGSFFMGQVWRVRLLSDGRMGASQGRAALIHLALGDRHARKTG